MIDRLPPRICRPRDDGPLATRKRLFARLATHNGPGLFDPQTGVRGCPSDVNGANVCVALRPVIGLAGSPHTAHPTAIFTRRTHAHGPARTASPPQVGVSMTRQSIARDGNHSSAGRLLALALCAASATACAHSGMSSSSGASPAADMSATAPSPDPRVGLKAGLWDAQQAQWNIRLVSNSRPTGKFLGETNSDLAFSGPYVIQGSYNGFQVWDISNPKAPTLKSSDYCPASQSDVSVYKNLLFVSGEGTGGRIDCGDQGVKDTVSAERLRGIRIFDISDLDAPEERRQCADLPRLAHAHAARRSEGPRQRLRLRLRLGRRPLTERACRAASARRPTRTPTRRSSALKSSRCRSRIPSRPRSSAPRTSSTALALRSHTAKHPPIRKPPLPSAPRASSPR